MMNDIWNRALSSLLIAGLMSVSMAMEPLQVKQWKEDLAAYQKNLEQKHINLYHTLSREQFSESLSRIDKQLPYLSHYQAIIELMKLTRKIGDGHTALPLWEQQIHFYPFLAFNFDGEFRVMKTTEKLRHILGAKLVSIDSVAIKDVADKVGDITAFVENQYSRMDRMTRYMRVGELLHGLGITSSQKSANFKFKTTNDAEVSINMQALPRQQRLTALTASMEYQDKRIKPAEKKLFSSRSDSLWYSVLKEQNSAYIRFDQFPNTRDMAEFADDVLRAINRHRLSRLIIDLRNNYGGDFYVGLTLAHTLNLADSINWLDGVYVLIGRKTFSAAMNNAALYRQVLNATLVGEPTGGKPKGYQDMGQFTLPNSGLVVCYSKRFFQLQQEDSPMVLPDIPIKPDWLSVKNGKDKVVEWVLQDIDKKRHMQRN